MREADEALIDLRGYRSPITQSCRTRTQSSSSKTRS